MSDLISHFSVTPIYSNLYCFSAMGHQESCKIAFGCLLVLFDTRIFVCLTKGSGQRFPLACFFSSSLYLCLHTGSLASDDIVSFMLVSLASVDMIDMCHLHLVWFIITVCSRSDLNANLSNRVYVQSFGRSNDIDIVGLDDATSSSCLMWPNCCLRWPTLD